MSATSKRIAQFVIPKLDNDGQTLDWQHEVYQEAFCKVFGGFTAYNVSGGWINEQGKLFRDESVSYHIAMDETPACINALRTLARAAATECKQEAIFIVLPSGEVEFISA